MTVPTSSVAVLGSSCSCLLLFFGCSWLFFGCSWVFFACSWPVCACSWLFCACSWVFCDCYWFFCGCSWVQFCNIFYLSINSHNVEWYAPRTCLNHVCQPYIISFWRIVKSSIMISQFMCKNRINAITLISRSSYSWGLEVLVHFHKISEHNSISLK